MTTSNINRDAQLSTIANAAYLEKQPQTISIGGVNWEYVDQSKPTTSGFYGVAYRNPQTNEIAVGYRGTDGMSDLKADTTFANGGWNQQFTDAAKFTADVKVIANRDYGGAKMLTTGHSLGDGIAQIMAKLMASALPAAANFVASGLPAAPGYGGVPASNYRTLRDTDNVYYPPSGGVIGFTASQVKINYNNRSYMIGTDGADSFDSSTYAQTGYFNNSLLVNFLGGGGNDVMGGSVRNDNLWGGTGNDSVYGYAGDDKVYGEEGDDVLYGDLRVWADLNENAVNDPTYQRVA